MRAALVGLLVELGFFAKFSLYAAKAIIINFDRQ